MQVPPFWQGLILQSLISAKKGTVSMRSIVFVSAKNSHTFVAIFPGIPSNAGAFKVSTTKIDAMSVLPADAGSRNAISLFGRHRHTTAINNCGRKKNCLKVVTALLTCRKSVDKFVARGGAGGGSAAPFLGSAGVPRYHPWCTRWPRYTRR